MKAFAIHIILVLVVLACVTNLQAEEIVITAVGDIMLAGKWTPFLKKAGYSYPFDHVRAELAGSDIGLANLESPIAAAGQEFTGKRFRFRAEPPVAKAIRDAGFTAVTLANNHTMDFGAAALLETLEHLHATGIATVGADKNSADARAMAIVTAKGKKIALLGYSLTQPVEFFAGRNRPGTAPGYEPFVRMDIAAARSAADYVIVSFHWGKEATGTVQEYQTNMAHIAVDSGADIVIGHHPHVLQGIERYKTGIIFYSLGNFAFASKSKTADVSALLRFRLDDTHRTVEVIPLDVLYRRVGFQPRPLTGARGAAVIGKLNQLSEDFATTIENKDGRYVIEF